MVHNSCRYSALLCLLINRAGAWNTCASSSLTECWGCSAREEPTAEAKIFGKKPCHSFVWPVFCFLFCLRAAFKVKIILIGTSPSFSRLYFTCLNPPMVSLRYVFGLIDSLECHRQNPNDQLHLANHGKASGSKGVLRITIAVAQYPTRWQSQAYVQQMLRKYPTTKRLQFRDYTRAWLPLKASAPR